MNGYRLTVVKIIAMIGMAVVVIRSLECSMLNKTFIWATNRVPKRRRGVSVDYNVLA